jgi:hypothetical protein
MDGLIRHLKAAYGGADGLLSQKVIELRASSVLHIGSQSPEQILSEGPTSYFHSNYAPGQWLSIDFKDMSVLPTHYTLLMRSAYAEN